MEKSYIINFVYNFAKAIAFSSDKSYNKQRKRQNRHFAKYVDFTKYLFFISCLKNINKQYYSNRIIQAYKSLVMSLGLVVINLNSLVC